MPTQKTAYGSMIAAQFGKLCITNQAAITGNACTDEAIGLRKMLGQCQFSDVMQKPHHKSVVSGRKPCEPGNRTRGARGGQ